MSDRLRPLWDFDDLDASEQRFRAALAGEASDVARAEILTQLARAEGLRGDFDAGERLVLEAVELAGTSRVAAARIDLERGRLRRSSGDREGALPLFESAYATATAAGEWFIAADAAHMAALAAPGREAFVEWTQRGIALGEEHAEASYWAGPLLNNLGWEYLDAGEPERALGAFEHALAAREREPGERYPIEIARFAVARTLRALGRSSEAIPLLEQAVAWAVEEGTSDGWFHEELALGLADVGRVDEAREQAKVAVALLDDADPSFPEDPERRPRLVELAGLG